jgi:hypothetical protein
MLGGMRRGVVGRAALTVVIAATAVACRRRMDVEYVSHARPAPPQHAAVLLQVFDRRPPGRGGDDPARAGLVRGQWGQPKGLRIASDAVPRNVWAATADALARAGIGASGGPNRLYASVLDFWEDAFTSEGSHIVVLYRLVDPADRELWRGSVSSGTGEPGDPSVAVAPETQLGPVDSDLNVFTYALAELAARATAAFASPAFQQATAPSAPPP